MGTFHHQLLFHITVPARGRLPGRLDGHPSSHPGHGTWQEGAQRFHVAELTEQLGAQEIAPGRRLHHALGATPTLSFLDQPDEPGVFQSSDVVAESLAWQIQTCSKAAGRVRFGERGENLRTRRLEDRRRDLGSRMISMGACASDSASVSDGRGSRSCRLI